MISRRCLSYVDAWSISRRGGGGTARFFERSPLWILLLLLPNCYARRPSPAVPLRLGDGRLVRQRFAGLARSLFAGDAPPVSADDGGHSVVELQRLCVVMWDVCFLFFKDLKKNKNKMFLVTHNQSMHVEKVLTCVFIQNRSMITRNKQ